MNRWFRRPSDDLPPAVPQASDDSYFSHLESELLQQTHPQEVYARILASAALLVQPIEVAAALLLLKDEATQPLKPSASQIAASGGWITVARTLGDYRTETKEWPLAEGSVTRTALVSTVTQRIDDVRHLKEDRYKSGGAHIRSELNVPLIEHEVVWGTIDLLSPQSAAFVPEHATKIERLAKIAVRAIARIATVEQDQNQVEELGIAQQIQAALTPLARTDISVDEVDATCQNVMDTILALAFERTGSVLGQVIVAMETPGKAEPDLVVYAVKGLTNPNAPQRWPASYGNTGKAFMRRKPVLLTDIKPSEDDASGTGEGGTFLPFFLGQVRSELAVPMLIQDDLETGDTSTPPIGVVNVESELPHHYTNTHQHLLAFLARQAGFAYLLITLAAKRARDRRLTALEQVVRHGIDEFRSFTTINDIDHGRNALRQRILDETVTLLGLSKATIFIASGVYSHEETTGDRSAPNTITGRMVEVTTAPMRLSPEKDRETIAFDRSMSGLVFELGQVAIFNTLAERPSIFHVARDQREDEVQSGGVLPLFEGTRTIGTFVLDADHEGQFSPENVDAATEVAEMISAVVVAARLRSEEIQSQRLRAFERQILATRVSDKEAFFKQILDYAAQLSDSDATWGQYAEIRRYPKGDGTFAPRITATYSATLDPESGRIDDWLPVEYSPQQIAPISEQANPLFARILSTQQGILLVDTPSELNGYPSVLHAEARSLICVPLLRPSTQNPKVSEVVGILSVTSDRPARLNDSDLKALTLFAQTVTLGLLNQDQLDLLQDFINQVIHDESKVITPLIEGVRTAESQVNQLTGSVALAHISPIAQNLQHMTNLAYLLQDLLFASQDITDNHPSVDSSSQQTLILADILAKMRISAETLATINNRHLDWVAPELPPYAVAGGPRVGDLIQAALFQYLINAFKHSKEGSAIHIAVDLQPPDHSTAPEWLVVTVRSHGNLISADEQPFLFDRGFRGTNLSANDKGRGIGLFLAARIAEKLYGKTEYRAEQPDTNVFVLLLPRALNPTRLRGA